MNRVFPHSLLTAIFFSLTILAPVVAEDPDTDGKDAPNVRKLDSGLVIEDIEIGEGKEVKEVGEIVVHYTGWLADGIKIDSSVDRKTPFTFSLGKGMVIKGWDEGVPGMKVGGKRKLFIPAELAYGDKGAGETIPPNSSLIFEIELLEVK